MSDEIDDIDAQIEKLREKVKKNPERFGADLSAAYGARYAAQKRQFEASIKRRAALHKKKRAAP